MAQTVVRSAMIIIAVTLLGRVVGLFREILLGDQFGASWQTDAYSLAFTIPHTIFLFVPGALNAIFVPSLKAMMVRGEEVEARALFRKMLTVTTAIYLVIMIAGILFSRPIIEALTFMQHTSAVISPAQRAEQVELAVQLLQLMWPSAVFIALIGVFQATLNAHQQFFIPNVSTVINSLVICAAYPLLVPTYGIAGVAIGTSIGFLCAALSMMPSLRKQQYSLAPDWRWNTDEMRKIGERFVPIMVGSLITQLYSFIQPVLSAGLGEGTVSALRFAYNIYLLPMGIFVAAFTLPIYPYLVEYYTKGELDRMKQSISEGMQYLFILMLPVITAMVVIPDRIVSLLYYRGGSGEFTSNDVQLTAIALLYMGLGLFFLAARDLLTRAFYAMENTKITVIAATIGILANIGSSLLFIPYLGHGGVALGTTVGSLANMVLLAVMLRRKIGPFMLRAFWLTAGKTLAACAVMGAVLYAATTFITMPGVMLEKLYVLILIGLSAGVFFAVLIVLREPLALQIIGRFAGKLFKRKRGAQS